MSNQILHFNMNYFAIDSLSWDHHHTLLWTSDKWITPKEKQKTRSWQSVFVCWGSVCLFSFLTECKPEWKLSCRCLAASFQTEVKGGQRELIQPPSLPPSLPPLPLIVMPSSNGFSFFSQDDFVPVRRIQQICQIVWTAAELSILRVNSERTLRLSGSFHSLHSSPPSKTNIWRLLCCLSVFYHFKTLSSYGWSKL